MKVGKHLLSWGFPPIEENDDGFNWELLCDELTAILQNKNSSGMWHAKVENFGWRNMNGEAHIEATDGVLFLQKILPDCECSFKIFDYGECGLAIQNYHHDSPTGDEWYYIVPETEQ